MKLLLKITAWLAMAFTVLLAVWAVCFYFATTDEINDETDDSLIDYSDALIIRKLAGVELPRHTVSTAPHSVLPLRLPPNTQRLRFAHL